MDGAAALGVEGAAGSTPAGARLAEAGLFWATEISAVADSIKQNATAAQAILDLAIPVMAYDSRPRFTPSEYAHHDNRANDNGDRGQ